MDTRTELIDLIQSLTQEGGTGNQLLISGGTGWLVLRAQKGEPHLRCEIATSAHLPEGTSLPEAALQALPRTGYVPVGRASSRRHRIYIPDSPAAAADNVLEMMAALYQADPDALHLQIALEDARGIKNPSLIKAMRKLSKVRSHEARIALYQELVNARLILAVDNGQPRQLETIGDWPVFGVFTDDESVRHFDPRGTPTQVRYGYQLFPQLITARAGILKINPDGMVGGELYRNELQTLADAVRRIRG